MSNEHLKGGGCRKIDDEHVFLPKIVVSFRILSSRISDTYNSQKYRLNNK